MAFAAHEASFVSNAEAYCFIPCSAFTVLHFIWESMGKPAYEEGSLFPEELPRISLDASLSERFLKFSNQNTQWSNLYCAGNIYNTCNVIEAKYIDLLAQTQPSKKYWAIGPFNPVTFGSGTPRRHRCLEWLDKQPPSSVIYVSFGTMTSISDDQIAELSIGLERSEQRFVWVLRDADLGDIYTQEGRKAQLPDGFEERIGGVGMVVRDWAPQVQILAHEPIHQLVDS
ncbi:Zeatin o-glucosyltransferase [Thalictrum thalictroides]|uniref:Zeatin o-glucosyltransferase n=1 Tax=Thalictrum thalictroides TaxID=46969 RepID=A0A7J6WIS8_THATH|nr:Zeatin o-glucosyltransferase [Thalictrum thalictroides]